MLVEDPFEAGHASPEPNRPNLKPHGQIDGRRRRCRRLVRGFARPRNVTQNFPIALFKGVGRKDGQGGRAGSCRSSSQHTSSVDGIGRVDNISHYGMLLQGPTMPLPPAPAIQGHRSCSFVVTNFNVESNAKSYTSNK